MTYKTLILLLCLVSYSLCAYKCADELKLDTCKLSTSTYTYVKACGKGKTCEHTEGGAYACVKRKNLLEEGDKCIVDEECQSGVCKDKKCTVLKDGDTCKQYHNENCGNGSYCKQPKDSAGSYTCAKYLAPGADCNTAEDPYARCPIGYQCIKAGDSTKKTCVQYYSLADGTAIDGDYDDENYNVLNACKSKFVFAKADSTSACGSVKNVTECVVDPSNSNRAYCTVGITFDGTTDNKMEKECSSHRDDSGNLKFECRYEVSSQEFNAYVEEYGKKLKEILEDEDIKISNLDSDHLNDKDLIEKYVEYYHKNDVSSDDDKDCVMDYFIREEGSNQMKLTLITLFISLLLI